MMTVERQLPRNSKIMTLVSRAAIAPSRATPVMAERTNSDWSPIGSICRLSGKEAFASSAFCLIPAMMANVDADPFLNTVSSTERLPST